MPWWVGVSVVGVGGGGVGDGARVMDPSVALPSCASLVEHRPQRQRGESQSSRGAGGVHGACRRVRSLWNSATTARTLLRTSHRMVLKLSKN